MLALACSCAQVPLPDHTLFIRVKDLPQLRSLHLSWASREPVMFGDTLMGLTQLKSLFLSWASPEPVMYGDILMGLTRLESLNLHLADCTRLQQLPPHITSLTLHTWRLLDMATAPLKSCPGLQCLKLESDAGEHTYAVA